MPPYHTWEDTYHPGYMPPYHTLRYTLPPCICPPTTPGGTPYHPVYAPYHTLRYTLPPWYMPPYHTLVVYPGYKALGSLF